MKLVLATANPDKAVEISAILRDVQLEARPDSVPPVEEDGDSIEENARIKAKAVMEATGQAAVADDTGLEVDALDGAPGVLSSRYAGVGATYSDNVRKLLFDLDEVPTDKRGARFRTVALVMMPDGTEIVAEGVVEGVILGVAKGLGGFGYDPVFAPLEGGGLTLSEMSFDDKNAISHRGRAFRELARKLSSLD